MNELKALRKKLKHSVSEKNINSLRECYHMIKKHREEIHRNFKLTEEIWNEAERAICNIK